MYKVISKATGMEFADAVAVTPDGKAVCLSDNGYRFLEEGSYDVIQYAIPSKEQFVKILKEIEDANRKRDRINDVIGENCIDGFLFYHMLDGTILDYLKEVFYDDSDAIGYFAFELDYGKKWAPGMITANGDDVPMQTAEQLYDLLVDNINQAIKQK